MDENLSRLRRWMGRATMRQFYTELETHLPAKEYALELEGDILTVYRLEKRRGLLGLGARTVRRPCLQATHQSDGIEVQEACADPQFVALLAELLRLR